MIFNFFKELEKMYYEILRVIDPDKNCNFSRTSAQSSTSLSLLSGASSTKEPPKKSNNKIHHHQSQQNLNSQQRNAVTNNNINNNFTSPRKADMK